MLFTLIAVVFLLFALPCFLFVNERGNPNPRPVFDWQAIKGSTRDTIATLRIGAPVSRPLRFLVGRVFYTDAINTVITIMTLYTVNVAVASGQAEAAAKQTAQQIMMVAITFAVIGGFVWGWLVDRIGPEAHAQHRALDVDGDVRRRGVDGPHAPAAAAVLRGGVRPPASRWAASGRPTAR